MTSVRECMDVFTFNPECLYVICPVVIEFKFVQSGLAFVFVMPASKFTLDILRVAFRGFSMKYLWMHVGSFFRRSTSRRSSGSERFVVFPWMCDPWIVHAGVIRGFSVDA